MLQTDFLNVLTGATITQLSGTTNIDGIDIDINAYNLISVQGSGGTSLGTYISYTQMYGNAIGIISNSTFVMRGDPYVQIGNGADGGSPDNSGLKITSGCTFQLRTEGGTNKILRSDDKGYASWVNIPSGFTGTSGSSGINGINLGSSGSSGSSGTSGSSGSSGSSGKSGSSGSSGSSGTSGSSLDGSIYPGTINRIAFYSDTNEISGCPLIVYTISTSTITLG